MSNKESFEPTRNIYTKLEDVLYPELNKNKNIEEFPSINNYTKNKKGILKRSTLVSQPETTKHRQYVNKPYVTSFINVINSNSSIIPNYQEVIATIEKNFHIEVEREHKELKDRNGKNQNAHETLVPNDANFYRLANEKIENNKKKYGVQQTNLEDIFSLNTNSNIKEESKANESKREEESFRSSNKKKLNHRFEILKANLAFLQSNEITIKQLCTKNPLQSKPYSLDNSLEFLEAVKFDNVKIVEAFLKKSKNYLFVYDFFKQTAYHWAAKRNNKRMLGLLIQTGKHCNQLDINHRTPLFLAAKNNNLEACTILVDNGGNPFIPDKDGKLPSDVTTKIEIRSLLVAAGDTFSNIFKYVEHKK